VSIWPLKRPPSASGVQAGFAAPSPARRYSREPCRRRRTAWPPSPDLRWTARPAPSPPHCDPPPRRQEPRLRPATQPLCRLLAPPPSAACDAWLSTRTLNSTTIPKTPMDRNISTIRTGPGDPRTSASNRPVSTSSAIRPPTKHGNCLPAESWPARMAGAHVNAASCPRGRTGDPSSRRCPQPGSAFATRLSRNSLSVPNGLIGTGRDISRTPEIPPGVLDCGQHAPGSVLFMAISVERRLALRPRLHRRCTHSHLVRIAANKPPMAALNRACFSTTSRRRRPLDSGISRPKRKRIFLPGFPNQKSR